MADTVLTDSMVILAKNYANKITRNINRKAMTLKTLDMVPVATGRSVNWVAESSGAIAEAYLETDTPSNFGSDAQTEVVLPLAKYWAPFHISGFAEATAANSMTPQDNIDLWARSMTNSAAALSSLINGKLYTGTGSPDCVGLESAIGDDANTYGGIDRSIAGNAYWRPYVVDPGVLTAITFGQIREDMFQIMQKCGQRPDLAFVSPAVYNAIAALFDNQKFYIMQPIPIGQLTPTSSGKQFALDGGQLGLVFDGMIIVEDKDCTANTIFYINTNEVRIHFMPFGQLVPGAADETEDMLANDGIEQIMLMLRLEMLGKANDTDRGFLKTYLQLQVERPNTCGARLNVAV